MRNRTGRDARVKRNETKRHETTRPLDATSPRDTFLRRLSYLRHHARLTEPVLLLLRVVAYDPPFLVVVDVQLDLVPRRA